MRYRITGNLDNWVYGDAWEGCIVEQESGYKSRFVIVSGKPSLWLGSYLTLSDKQIAHNLKPLEIHALDWRTK